MKPTSGSKGRIGICTGRVDSTGQTIDFLLTAKRDADAAKRFFRKTLLDPANPQPRVINVDKNRAYPAAGRSSEPRQSAVGMQLPSALSICERSLSDHRTAFGNRRWSACGGEGRW